MNFSEMYTILRTAKAGRLSAKWRSAEAVIGSKESLRGITHRAFASRSIAVVVTRMGGSQSFSLAAASTTLTAICLSLPSQSTRRLEMNGGFGGGEFCSSQSR